MCDCIKKANDALAEHNTAVETVTTITPKGKIRERLCVPTRRMSTKKRGTPMRVFATYCPMCGVEIPGDG